MASTRLFRNHLFSIDDYSAWHGMGTYKDCTPIGKPYLRSIAVKKGKGGNGT